MSITVSGGGGFYIPYKERPVRYVIAEYRMVRNSDGIVEVFSAINSSGYISGLEKNISTVLTIAVDGIDVAGLIPSEGEPIFFNKSISLKFRNNSGSDDPIKVYGRLFA